VSLIAAGGAHRGSVRGFYPKNINGSLRFNDDDSAYLSWTPASAGNRKTWTWSGWVKRGNIAEGYLFGVEGADTNNRSRLGFNASHVFEFNNRTSSGNVITVNSTAVFRDPSAWYHIVFTFDSTEATQADRAKLWVNGVSTSVTQNVSIGLNEETYVSSTFVHNINDNGNASAYKGFDGYQAEVHFTDGTAYDADAFGEFKNGVWVAKTPDVTYGTNGFYLDFQDDTEVEAFNTVLFRATGTQSVTGMGFKPDLVWVKARSTSGSHHLMDSVRGASKFLQSDTTDAEATSATFLTSFDDDGFSFGSNNWSDGRSMVAWGWKAGDSNVSNTDGSITSTVRDNDTYGFSIVSYTGNSTDGATVGHGLGATPDFIIIKSRSSTGGWIVYHSAITTNDAHRLQLNDSGALFTSGTPFWELSAFSNSVFGLGNNNSVNDGDDHIAYCWAEKSGYSKFGSYTGDSTNGVTVSVGFKPAFLLVKNTSHANNWFILDNTRQVPEGLKDDALFPNSSSAEITNQPNNYGITFTDTGFEVNTTGDYNSNSNNSTGDTYIYAAFADTREAAFWLDQSGNDNDWQPVNLDHNDTVADSPTDNFATLNPLDKNSNLTLSNGNLDFVPANTSDLYSGRSTFQIPSTGKWIWQVTNTNSAYMITAGLIDGATPLLGQQTVSCASMTVGSIGTFFSTTQWMNTTTSWSVTNVGNGDTLVIAYDADAGKIWFGRVASGGSTVSWYNTSGTADPSTGTDPRASGITAGKWFAGVGAYYTPSGASINYGQRPFAFTNAPTDYLALSTANLPNPAIDPAQGSSPSDYFNTVLYTGTGTSSNAITGVGFQPDLVWIKPRNTVSNHAWYDSIRGVNQRIKSNSTDAESTLSGVSSFDSDGFSLGSSYNETNNHVAWNWKANGSGVSNTDGTITSTVSANTESGFSVVKYEGTGTAATVGHGLNQAPEMIFCKRLDRSGDDWKVYAEAIGGGTHQLTLNSTAAASTNSAQWNDTDTTATVFSIGTSAATNGTNQIAYCFHSVEGFSKIGKWAGTSDTDGPFVYLGFRPAFMLFKRNGTANWVIYDKERDPFNFVDERLFPNTSDAESGGGASYSVDWLSNGMKIRTNGSQWNQSGSDYIYMAFAENPFKYSNAR